MELRIDVCLPDGTTRVGAGPITSATDWTSTSRLDRAGSFSFTVPAADPRASYLASHNVVVASLLIGGAWAEIGRGIVDTVRAAGSAQPTLLTVTGADMLRELVWRSVGALTLATPTTPGTVATGVTSLAPTDIHTLKIDLAGGGGPYGTFPYGYVDVSQARDGNLATNLGTNLGAWHFWYLCADDPYTAVDVFLSGFNADACTWRIQYFDGTAWVDLASVVDGTLVGGKTFARNGTISWALPIDWAPLEQSICQPPGNVNTPGDYVNLTGYWTRWLPQGPPADGDGGSVIAIEEITIAGLVPTAQAAAQILGYADGLADGVADPVTGAITGTPLPGSPPSQGWAFDVVAGQAGTLATDVFAQIQDDTVLAALMKLSELTNEHFRAGSGTRLVWLGKNTPSSGVRAIRPWRPA